MASMSSIADDPAEELRLLRERAYGRAADIHDDPAALQRLQELEDHERAAAAAPVETPSAGDADPEKEAPTVDVSLRGAMIGSDHTQPETVGGAYSDAETGTTADAGIGEAGPVETPASKPWWKRRMPRVWAASLVAAIVLGVVLTLSAQALQAGKIAVLSADEEVEWPSQFWGDRTEGSHAYETFFGMSVISQPQQLGAGSEDLLPCLTVFSGDGDNLMYAAGGCGAGPFPATATFSVGIQSPSELRERFPDGTALQFVLEGEQVHVYARAPVLGDPTP
jgi:hypothetical protein